MNATTKTFIEDNIYLLDKDLASFLELASYSYYSVEMLDLIDTLQEAQIEGIEAAQYQVLINRLYLEFRDTFNRPNAPVIVEISNWILERGNFNIGLSTDQILNHIIKEREEYSGIVDIFQDSDASTWIMSEAW